MCKGEGSIRISAVGLNRLKSMVESMAEIGTRRLINSLSTACLGGQEIASSIAAYCLLGHTRFYESHKFAHIFPFRALKMLKAKVRPQTPSNSPTPIDSDSDSDESDEPRLETIETLSDPSHVFDPTPLYNYEEANCLLQPLADDQVNYKDDEPQSEIIVASTKWVNASQDDNYAYRPRCLQDICFVNFTCIYQLVARNTRQSESARGRPNNETYELLPNHPLHNSHQLKARTFAGIPVFASGIPPKLPAPGESSNTASAKRKTWALYWSYLIMPWRTMKQWSSRSFANVHAFVVGCIQNQHHVIAMDATTMPHLALLELRRSMGYVCMRTTRGIGATRHARFALNGLRMSNADNVDNFTCPKQESARDTSDDILIEYGSTPEPSIEQTLDALLADNGHNTFIPSASRHALNGTLLAYTLQHIREAAKLTDGNIQRHNSTASKESPAEARANHQARFDTLLEMSDLRPVQKDVYKTLVDALLDTLFGQKKPNKRTLQQPPPSDADASGTPSPCTDTLPDSHQSSTHTHTAATATSTANVPLQSKLYWIEGNAGTGKTHTIQALLSSVSKILGSQCVAACAYQGVTATNLWLTGRTLHSMFKFPAREASTDETISSDATDATNATHKQRDNNADDLALRLSDLKMLVIDEISLIKSTLLHAIDTVLRHHKDSTQPFGGVLVICMGDFYQLDPVGGYPLLKEYFLNATTNTLWGRAIRLKLEANIRQENDKTLQKMASDIRTNGLVDPNILRQIPFVSSNDLKDSEIMSVHAKNEARIACAFQMLRNYSARTGHPLVIWNMPLYNDNLSENVSQRLHFNVNALTETFCFGARAVITQNICTELGLCNGTRGFYYDLLFDDAHTNVISSLPHNQHVIRLPPNVHPKTIILAIPVTEITEKQSWELRTVNDVLCWLVPIRRESIKIALPSSLFVNKSAAQLPGGRRLFGDLNAHKATHSPFTAFRVKRLTCWHSTCPRVRALSLGNQFMWVSLV